MCGPMYVPRLVVQDSLDPRTVIEFEVRINRRVDFRYSLASALVAVLSLVLDFVGTFNRIVYDIGFYIEASARAGKPRTDVVGKRGEFYFRE